MTLLPRVAIITVNWNGKDVTLDCLQSLRALTYPSLLVIVVDNASTDGSVEGIRKGFPDVTLLPLPENRRFAGGNNSGIQQALAEGAELLLLLNNDTVVERDFLTHMVERLQADPSTGMVSPKILYHRDPDRIWFAGSRVSLWTGTMRHIGIRELDRGQYDTPRAIDYATGCCLLTSREVVAAIGMLDESFFIYGEDADWSMRARRAGYSIQYEPRARVWHKLSVSAGGHLSWYKLRNKFLGNLRFFVRYAAWYHWFVFPWLNLLVNGYAALRYLLTVRLRSWN
jgi:hypothetical protein